ncbi:MAG: GIY-YIG nuclease family protein [Bacteroidia bacterium]|nr:GIY-YIG nuclease family protein [Bacteroidia bacterium]NNK71358.1 GIY-YIG nuclease family protein [Flavobacteriaceae bacterium]NNL80500.1 GIY-YIG nuclease family protein [Flavobacteriaceae bacterium]
MSRTHQYWIYILTNKPRGTLYIGITNNLDRRMYEHRNGLGSIFTKRYGLRQLVYFEEFQWVQEAIAREKQLKNWNRAWKIELIEHFNPRWIDLSNSINGFKSSGC